MKPIALLFLCAGASRRMGRSKALLPWQASSLLEHHWNLLQGIEDYTPWIVTQSADRALFAELDRMGWPPGQRIDNPIAPAGDMADSIRCGIAACLLQNYRAVGIALIDQPLIGAATFRTLAESAQKYPDAILQPTHEQRRGHPVLLPIERAKEFLRGTHESLKTFLAAKEDLRRSVEVNDPGILIDLDTPQDYSKYERQGCL